MSCGWLLGHHWEKWKVINSGKISYKGQVKGTFIIQQRTCLICGRTQTDMEKATI